MGAHLDGAGETAPTTNHQEEEMIEWFLFLATLVLPLLVARCIATMGSEDSADHDVWRRMCVKEDGHEWD